VDVRPAFGNRIRELRKARGLSQEELSHRAGLDYRYIGGVERGERNPSLISITRLANALDVPLSELFESLHNRLRTPPKGPRTP
jgi:transcriptional regulator with XRE-family HTH domain